VILVALSIEIADWRLGLMTALLALGLVCTGHGMAVASALYGWPLLEPQKS
jgi:hypothetical protein